MVILGWLIGIAIILYFSFRLIDQIKSYMTSLEVRVDLLENHVQLLNLYNEDCEKMINELSERINFLENNNKKAP